MTPTQLVSGIQSGNPEAEAVLFRTVWHYRHSRNIDRVEAEDLAQDALLKCWVSIRSGALRDASQALAFAGTVHRNEKRQWLRQRRETLEIKHHPIDPNTPERDILRNERALTLTAAMRFLTERDRTILTRWANGETLPQIAASLGMNLSTVKTHHYRAKLEMRKRLTR
jgi:RNA polymerase sigma factor (sigma-70 family)